MNQLFTYGYTGGALADLQRHAEAGAMIVDVRFRAASRNPAWAKGVLQKALGARYQHLPLLGNRNYKNGGPIELANPEVGLEQLALLLKQGPVVILCACAEIATCHRLTVADEAQRRWPELRVRHLKPGEGIESDQPALF